MSKVGGGDPRSFIVLDRLYGTLGDKMADWSHLVKEQTQGFFANIRNKEKIGLLWNERLLAMYDIARAMKYLHSKE